MSEQIKLQGDKATQLARSRLAGVRPAWVGIRHVADVVPNCERTVFHAGPPFAAVVDVPAPVRNSICVAALYEGWAGNFTEAAALLDGGEIHTAAAQDHGLLVPLSGVLSPTMAVLEVRDGQGIVSTAIYVAINEGQVHATRLGQLDDETPAHLRWLNGPFSEWLAQRIALQSIELAPLIAQALSEGDDSHARTVSGSRLLGEVLLRDAPSGPDTDAAREFIAKSPSFALNPWMGAAALWQRAAEGVSDCSWISRAGGNGQSFGIQLANRPGHWITMPAPVPTGSKDAEHVARSAVGALGDSAVVDFVGLGAQALAHAPLLRDALAAALPTDILQRPMQVLSAPGVVDGLKASITDARLCVSAGCGPVVLIGMIDAAGEAGRIGPGVVQVPVELFHTALSSLKS